MTDLPVIEGSAIGITDLYVFDDTIIKVIPMINAVYPGTVGERSIQMVSGKPGYYIGSTSVFLDLSNRRLYVIRPVTMEPLENELFIKVIYGCDAYFDCPSEEGIRSLMNASE